MLCLRTEPLRLRVTAEMSITDHRPGSECHHDSNLYSDSAFLTWVRSVLAQASPSVEKERKIKKDLEKECLSCL